jgi:hypothetical protein
MAGDGGSCWCFDTPIAEGAIERIPEDLRGRACLCQACATAPSAGPVDLDVDAAERIHDFRELHGSALTRGDRQS